MATCCPFLSGNSVFTSPLATFNVVFHQLSRDCLEIKRKKKKSSDIAYILHDLLINQDFKIASIKFSKLAYFHVCPLRVREAKHLFMRIYLRYSRNLTESFPEFDLASRNAAAPFARNLLWKSLIFPRCLPVNGYSQRDPTQSGLPSNLLSRRVHLPESEHHQTIQGYLSARHEYDWIFFYIRPQSYSLEFPSTYLLFPTLYSTLGLQST